jgi:hypothetical protein
MTRASSRASHVTVPTDSPAAVTQLTSSPQTACENRAQSRNYVSRKCETSAFNHVDLRIINRLTKIGCLLRREVVNMVALDEIGT